ncbi:M48 family metalloprotease [Alteriqipengyuania flavescens]|uniref:M48 family metalloprotease n=1 Tax=Alteriqipengyuania flavescens TaxID=3053610 RepID=UPI0025B2C765|nr:M48 family metalloprotease [Alteriqipengyuania flavescens]WJY18521.1 M48 family metalloprotease [Alteriqipengyuania flavescens]WJY24461.1 M48 family metalloprotease [Alteriqipengyuania flavescens]
MTALTQKFRFARLAAGTATALALSACASIPGANVPAGSPITPEEAKIGQEAHPQFIQQFGGQETGPAAAYVEMIGKDISVRSGLAGARDSFTVTTLDSSVNNAFAVPGGYVYITRQLVGLMNNEAELAGVLGHEVGHVAARHSARRQQTAQRNQLLGILGQVASAVLLGDSALGRLGQQVAGQAPQLATLSYSRSQEIEADQLGITYLSQAGYDPRAMATVLASLAAQNSLDSQLQGRGNATLPEWASTHPDPAERVNDALSFAAGKPGTTTNRDRFLSRIDGLAYGDKPEQGMIEGDTFIHPDFRLSFSAPNGFYMVNSPRAVSINGDRGQGQFTTDSYNGNLETYVRAQFAKLGNQQQQVTPQVIERTTVNGLPASYGVARVNNGQQQIDVTVFAYDFGGGRAYHFLTITQAGQTGIFNPMFQSVRRISDAEAARVVPRIIDVVVAGSGDSVATLSRRMAYDSAQEARFRVLNGLSSTDQVRAGQSYKIVVRGR